MPTSDFLIYSLTIMLCINVMLTAGQYSADNLNPDSHTKFYDPSNTLICYAFNNNCQQIIQNRTLADTQQQLDNKLPDFTSTVSATGSNSFFDTPVLLSGNIKSEGKANYLKALITAPSQFLVGVGIEPPIANLIGGVWYLIIMTLLILVIFGR